MWPWSTIRNLRSELAAAQDDAERFSTNSGRLAKENESLRQRWTTLKENYETVSRDLGVAQAALVTQSDSLAKVIGERDQISAQRDETVADCLRLTNELRKVAGVAEARSATIAKLQRQLAEASKNDKRNPKTGRFEKAGA